MKSRITSVKLRAELGNWHSFPVWGFPALERCRELLLLVPVDIFPAGRSCQLTSADLAPCYPDFTNWTRFFRFSGRLIATNA